ncbi:hypothetical protein RBSWK_02273 [Rhodopirellula baltica SWK14]|uniref:Uncharacterized protein n=1 Tax=Rhodopirellula baltica SWK14 TaxID=993516 RepID=L7CL47_RHOBT|nr:hypothetical protein RBSWK_02273 [Rhodopirellula baltica SWK14]
MGWDARAGKTWRQSMADPSLTEPFTTVFMRVAGRSSSAEIWSQLGG